MTICFLSDVLGALLSDALAVQPFVIDNITKKTDISVGEKRL